MNHLFGCLLLLHCASASFLFIGGYGNVVSVYNFNELTGAMSWNNNVTSSYVSWMTWQLGASTIYGAKEYSNQLTAFSFNNQNGAMSVINTVNSGGSGPVSVANYNGNFLVTAHYTSGDVVVFGINENQSIGSSVFSVNAGTKAHQVVLQANFVFVPCLGSDYIAQYILNTTTGKLIPNPAGATLTITVGQGPRHMAFHPCNPVAYVINELGNTVSLLSYNQKQGTLSFVAQYSTLLPGFSGTNTGAEVQISNNGLFLYASNRGNNSIAIFSVAQPSGTLTLLGLEGGNSNIRSPRSFAVAPYGNFMVVANQDSGSIMEFQANTSSGFLTLKNTLYGFDQPAYVGIYTTSPITPDVCPQIPIGTTSTAGSLSPSTSASSSKPVTATTTSSAAVLAPFTFIFVLLFSI